MAPKSTCGPLTELTSNDAVRVARCGCGTVHVTLIASGVTLRMPTEALRNVGAGIAAALEKLEQRPPAVSSTGSTSIN